MRIRQVTVSNDTDWLKLRKEFWPSCPEEEHAHDGEDLVSNPRKAAFVLCNDEGEAAAFVELALRKFVNGCSTSPVAFVEGIFVAPQERRHGWARQLLLVAEDWARSKGCSELASDVLLDNEVSHALHMGCGFEETERVVYFRKSV